MTRTTEHQENAAVTQETRNSEDGISKTGKETKTESKPARKSTRKTRGKSRTHEYEEELNKLRDKIEELETRLKEQDDRYLRKLAEFDNYRKRTVRQQAELTATANSRLLEKLLPVLDDLDAMEKLDQGQTDAASLRKGLQLIQSKLLSILGTEGLKPMETLGKPFDPNLHDALTVMKDAEKAPGVVLVEQQRGYLLGDKILRHAKVVVNEDSE